MDNDKDGTQTAMDVLMSKFETQSEQLQAAVARITKLEATMSELAKPGDDGPEQSAVTNDNKETVHGIGPRNLVVCIDGTANQFGVKVSLEETSAPVAPDVLPPVCARTRTLSNFITSSLKTEIRSPSITAVLERMRGHRGHPLPTANKLSVTRLI